MFKPSQQRILLEQQLNARTEAEVCIAWNQVMPSEYSLTGMIRNLLCTSVPWPNDRFFPMDLIAAVFEGGASEDLPFNRFRLRLQKEHGIDVSTYDIDRLIKTGRPHLADLIRLIADRRPVQKLGADSKIDLPK